MSSHNQEPAAKLDRANSAVHRHGGKSCINSLVWSIHALPARRPYAEHKTVSNVVSNLPSISSQTMRLSQCTVSVRSVHSRNRACVSTRCRWRVLWSTCLLPKGRPLCVPRTSQAFHPGSLSRPAPLGCCSRRSPPFHNRSAALTASARMALSLPCASQAENSFGCDDATV